MTTERRLDLVCLGRAAVDLYAEQIGAPLEDAQSFAKYIGGCAANIAVGSARQGLRVAMLTRVGDEPMGRFVRQTLAAEGVDVSGVGTDPRRLTGLVLLGIRDRDTFPLIFYREDCADMALAVEDVDAELIGAARALLVTGTHFSQPGVDAASREAMRLAREAGTRVVLDIDYRPVLWGLTGPGLGEQRFVADDRVSKHLQSILPTCDLVVGTEEELHIAGGSTETLAALRRVREITDATIVLKRGPHGCVVFDGEIPSNLDAGVVGEAFSVEVLNVLGAGDAFLSGFLRGWIADEPLPRCCTYANASGALVVARHGCAPAIPTRTELDDFVERSAGIADITEDDWLRHSHRVTTRTRRWDDLCVFALDNRLVMEDNTREAGRTLEDLRPLKLLLARGAARAAERAGIEQPGVIIDDRWGSEALLELTGSGFWIARAVERSGLVPLTYEHEPNVGLTLRTWPQEHVVKCLMRFHPSDPESLRTEQLLRLDRLYRACLRTERELLLELLPPEGKILAGKHLTSVVREVYDRGIRPDWWKLEPQLDPQTCVELLAVLDTHDPFCRGVLLLGGGRSLDDLRDRFRVASRFDACRGFAVGRTIFAEPSTAWLRGELPDEGVVEAVAERFAQVVEVWRQRRHG